MVLSSFIEKQLFPNWEYFGSEMLSVDLNPFGKANVRFSVITLQTPTSWSVHSLW